MWFPRSVFLLCCFSKVEILQISSFLCSFCIVVSSLAVFLYGYRSSADDFCSKSSKPQRYFALRIQIFFTKFLKSSWFIWILNDSAPARLAVTEGLLFADFPRVQPLSQLRWQLPLHSGACRCGGNYAKLYHLLKAIPLRSNTTRWKLIPLPTCWQYHLP